MAKCSSGRRSSKAAGAPSADGSKSAALTAARLGWMSADERVWTSLGSCVSPLSTSRTGASAAPRLKCERVRLADATLGAASGAVPLTSAWAGGWAPSART